jgi:hypothetical protein
VRSHGIFRLRHCRQPRWLFFNGVHFVLNRTLQGRHQVKVTQMPRPVTYQLIQKIICPFVPEQDIVPKNNPCPGCILSFSSTKWWTGIHDDTSFAGMNLNFFENRRPHLQKKSKEETIDCRENRERIAYALQSFFPVGPFLQIGLSVVMHSEQIPARIFSVQTGLSTVRYSEIINAFALAGCMMVLVIKVI